MSLCSLAYRLQSNGKHTLAPVRPGTSPVLTRWQSEVEEHRQGRETVKRPRAGPGCNGVSARVGIASQANRVDPAEGVQSGRKEVDWQAAERAESEAMTGSPGAGSGPESDDDLRRVPRSGSLDARTKGTAVVQRGGL